MCCNNQVLLCCPAGISASYPCRLQKTEHPGMYNLNTEVIVLDEFSELKYSFIVAVVAKSSPCLE